MGKRVAVLLAGCGAYDGSEIHEASAALVHLSRAGAEVTVFAPDVSQQHVVDHASGKEQSGETERNVLRESSRIARGAARDLAQLRVADFDALLVPGGFGVAKNLSSWASEGARCSLLPGVEAALRAFREADKPVALCCIAPVLAARLFPGCELTVGGDSEQGGRFPYAGTAAAIRELGCTHVCTDVGEAHVDTKLKIVTTSAFMCATAPIHHVYDGVGVMVQEMLKLA
ncbi:putative glutamine amidotransferase-like class 1 domain-containing protein 3B, mitochondrial [Petromyzon marinus]|uniref:Glutamine amidotransferase-like class 1 domain-containing protein 3B, mitochondrial n=1 Tax=Petromyzon marinus TaxID=7757 RepID=A0AAJ7WXQ8_PETMA|nr:glutamine amidotransferase-like class 1 domain-containing protein 3B, mitochondrial [Petromyzon marinus]